MKKHDNMDAADNLQVKVYESREAMGKAASVMVLDRLHELLSQQDEVNMIFAAAPSQNEFLAALVAGTGIDWQRVNAFHMDEYIGLPTGDPRTFASFLADKVFSRLPFRSVNYINGNAADADAECKRYAALLTSYPPDVVCMGIGENGHIAFNDPPVADFNDSKLVKVVELDPECRQQQVNGGCFDSLDNVPTHALTLTVPALMAGRHIYCIVPGSKKSTAVFNTPNGKIGEKCPATVLRRHPDAVLFLDKKSSSLLSEN